jgi:hypothetical protein
MQELIGNKDSKLSIIWNRMDQTNMINWIKVLIMNISIKVFIKVHKIHPLEKIEYLIKVKFYRINKDKIIIK